MYSGTTITKLLTKSHYVRISILFSRPLPFLPRIIINIPAKAVNLSLNKNWYNQGIGWNLSYLQRWLTDKQVLHMIQRE